MDMEFPLKKITVNLAPADIKKEGSSFDLPVAIGMLAAKKLHHKLLEDTVFLGELSLDGNLRPIKGALSIAVEARKKGMKRIVLPMDLQTKQPLSRELMCMVLKI